MLPLGLVPVPCGGIYRWHKGASSYSVGALESAVGNNSMAFVSYCFCHHLFRASLSLILVASLGGPMTLPLCATLIF